MPEIYCTANFLKRVILCYLGSGFCALISGALQPAGAADGQLELTDPLVCSVFQPTPPALAGTCEITPITLPGDTTDKKRLQVKVRLEAQTKRIMVGGYDVTTENYGTYVPLVVEARPGDTVAAHLVNNLQKPMVQPAHATHAGGAVDPEANPTNLHYFHGGIVTPNNSRPMDAALGNGDNIYVHRKRGETFDFSVPIPGKGELDPAVLEGEGLEGIAHPDGLNWYHSHLHGISSTQVMGGLSSLLSVGDALANVKAACEEGPAGEAKCRDDTQYLKDHTDPKYVLLRDISLKDAVVSPLDADGTATATWAPSETDAPGNVPCGVRVNGQIDVTDPKKREGYCQRPDDTVQHSMNRLWLFTLNGQRFPKVTAKTDRNVLLRMGNLSANVGYWLELECEQGCDQVPEKYAITRTEGQSVRTFVKLEALSLDGVVPATFVRPGQVKRPANTFLVSDLLLMPASRVELYVRNDFRHDRQISLILRAKKLQVEVDADTAEVWPEIQLARVILEPSAVQSPVLLSLNAPVGSPRPALLIAEEAAPAEPPVPPGCVRDLKPETDLAKREHRRVIFWGGLGKWRVETSIVQFPQKASIPPDAPQCIPNQTCVDGPEFEAIEAETIGGGEDLGIPFEQYVNEDGSIDWTGQRHRHVCIYVDKTGRSHKQLWELQNGTSTLHNFHIHQMKFRLATISELNAYRIAPKGGASTCPSNNCATPAPDYRLYDDRKDTKNLGVEWHDTIPIPPGKTVYIIMSFDAEQQLGRYVYHCHILKHEDSGLMAPIEVINTDLVVTSR